MKKTTIAIIGLALFTGQAQASIMSLNEAKDKLATIQYHEASSRQDYLASKHAYKAACKARKALQKEIKAIAKANKLNDLAEASSIAYAERAHHYNEYLNAEILGSSTIRIKGSN